jgi:hypothetical protein
VTAIADPQIHPQKGVNEEPARNPALLGASIDGIRIR